MMKKIIIALMFCVTQCIYGATRTVGAGGDYNNIQTAINASSNGDTLILLANNTFTVGSTITVDKQITIQGQNRDNCILTANIAGAILNVTVSNVTLENFKMVQSNSGSLASDIAVNGSLTGIVCDGLNLVTSEFGITFAMNQFNVTNCIFTYIDTDPNDRHRFIELYGNIGNSKIYNNEFNGVFFPPFRGSRFVELSGSNMFTGSLDIKGNTQFGRAEALFVQDNFSGGDFALNIENNVFAAEGSSIAFYSSGLTNPLNLYSTISIIDNTSSGTSGSGLVVIDGDSGPLSPATDPSKIFIICNNKTAYSAITAPGYSAATGLGLIGYNNTVYTPFHVALPPCSLGILQEEVSFPTQSDIQNIVTWRSPDDTVAFHILNENLAVLAASTNTYFIQHNVSKNSPYTYYVNSYDSYEDQSRDIAISLP